MALQARFRGAAERRRQTKMKNATARLQARWRGHAVRKKSVVGVRHGMMSDSAHERDWQSGERGRLKASGLKDHEVSAVLRLSTLV
jgi:hypothetical protein